MNFYCLNIRMSGYTNTDTIAKKDTNIILQTSSTMTDDYTLHLKTQQTNMSTHTILDA